MLEEFLGPNKELLIYCSHKLINAVIKDEVLSKEDKLLCIFPKDREHPIITSNEDNIIKSSINDDEYHNNSFTRIYLNQSEEGKVLTLISIGLDFKEIIYLNYIKDKEDEIQWERYKDFESKYW